jgi:hypothetical protein
MAVPPTGCPLQLIITIFPSIPTPLELLPRVEAKFHPLQKFFEFLRISKNPIEASHSGKTVVKDLQIDGLALKEHNTAPTKRLTIGPTVRKMRVNMFRRVTLPTGIPERGTFDAPLADHRRVFHA